MASKLGLTRALADTTLPEDLGVADAHEDELYAVYSRDGKPGTLKVNYGLLTDSRGCPVSGG